MKVLVAVPPERRGGVARSSARLVRSLGEAGHDARLSFPDDALFPDEVSGSRFGLGDPGDLQRWTDLLLEVARAMDPDAIVGFYGTSAGFCAVAAASLLGKRSVLALRGNDLDRDFFLAERLPLLAFAVRRATRVAAVSLEMARKVEAWFPGVPVTAVPNAVDTELFRPDPDGGRRFREKWGLAGRVLGVFGDVKAKRGIERLARARALGRFRLLVVGRSRVPLPEGTRVVPWLEDEAELRAAYSACDVVAQPSVHDGMPNAVLEAMACERLVVASPVGGIPEVVRHGETGLLCSSEAEWDAALAGDLPALGAAARRAVPRPEQERDAWLAILR